ncbi:MAG: hypothetical protein QM533_05010 [Cytophagales bacterium]|nr:hypothetical protein [Cytophagales bacterium]
MNKPLINSEPFLRSPFKIILSDKTEAAHPEANLHAVKGDDGCLYLGGVIGTHNGNAFFPSACYAAGAWTSIHKL